LVQGVVNLGVAAREETLTYNVTISDNDHSILLFTISSYVFSGDFDFSKASETILLILAPFIIFGI
jgi:hypothetical protein